MSDRTTPGTEIHDRVGAQFALMRVRVATTSSERTARQGSKVVPVWIIFQRRKTKFQSASLCYFWVQRGAGISGIYSNFNVCLVFMSAEARARGEKG